MSSESHQSLLPCSQVSEWIRTLSSGKSRFSALLRDSGQGSVDGYRHTIREICQQPATWPETALEMKGFRDGIAESLADGRRIILTGSGSSQYAGECAAPALQRDLRRPVEVQGGGELLLRPAVLVSDEPTLVVSLARSGESPESVAVVRQLLETGPLTTHLVLTCNAKGKLAREFAGEARVRVVSLSEVVHDRSLVMTSSFTNLALSARFLGWIDRADEFVALAGRLDSAARRLLTTWPDRLGEFVSGSIDRIVFLGGGCRYAAAREAALKLLEMTGGKVATMAETYLGLRHGPMCFVNERTLLVCFLSSDPLIRAYERDLILELDAKRLGARKLVAGIEDPGAGLCGGADLTVAYDLPGGDVEDADLALLDVMIAQILGFHRCREEGLQPDSPSEEGIISRVVGDFRIHSTNGSPR
jgi:tagatose-6-phosphate ketose/aldose isomerase